MRKLAISLTMLGLVAAPATLLAQDRGLERSIFRLLNLEGHGVRWMGSAEGRTPTVTWAIATADMSFARARNCAAITTPDPLLRRSHIDRAVFETELRAAFAMWANAADIRFEEATSADTAGIVIGAQAEPEGRAYANVFHAEGEEEVRAIEKSIVCLNPRVAWKVGFDGNIDVYDLRYTLAHEIGHAIGLDHPAPSGALMSFRYEERFRELQRGDVEGAVALYGSRQFGSLGIAPAPADKP